MAERPRLVLANRLALRPREAAEALGISDRKFRQILPAVPHLRTGGAVLIPVNGLACWLEEQAKEQARVGRGRVTAAVEEVLDKIRQDE